MIGNEGGKAKIYNKEFIFVGDVGKDETSVADINANNLVVCGSGKYKQITADEEGDIIEYKPVLECFGLYGKA